MKNDPRSSVISVLWTNRLLRGLTQGLLLAWFLPDLHAMGWSPVSAGLTLSLGLLFDFLLTLEIGRQADRNKGIPILVAGEILAIVPCLLFLWKPVPVFLWTAAALSGLGQRSNGSPGPFTPAEQSTILRFGMIDRLFRTVSSNLAAGLLGMSIGALGGTLFPTARMLPPEKNLKGLIAILVITSFLNIVLLVFAGRSPEHSHFPFHPQDSPRSLLKEEKKNLLLLVASNSLFGLSMGLSDPSISYWFLLRFHATPESISLVLGVSFLTAALFSALLSRNHPPTHLFRATILLQFFAVIGLFLLPLPGSLGVACILFTLRFACLRGPGGIRQALAGSLVRREHAGWAQSIHLASLGAAGIFGPTLAGVFWKKGMVNAPIVLGGVLGFFSLILFLILYRNTSAKLSRSPTSGP